MRHGHLLEGHTRRTTSPAATETAGNGAAAGGGRRFYSRLVPEPSPPVLNAAVIEATKSMLSAIADERRSGNDVLPNDGFGGIPAAYTYFGQLIVHDLTRSFAVGDGQPVLKNLSTPSLDLDTIYGGGPRRCPHLYVPTEKPAELPHEFYVGRTAPAAAGKNWRLGSGLPYDLPRIDTGCRGIGRSGKPICVTPLIADTRNDDNLILAQLTAQFLLVHNTIARYLRTVQEQDSKTSYRRARHFVLKSYRQIVAHDYLEKLLLPNVHADFVGGKLRPAPGEVPIEFALGVARAGHAMVRNAYVINDHIEMDMNTLGEMMAFSSHHPEPNLPLPADWVVDWARLLDLSATASMSARRITPFLAPAFVNSDMSHRVATVGGSLSYIDLWRCYEHNVPSGQDCARQLLGQNSTDILTGARMLPTAATAKQHPADELAKVLQNHSAFLDATPLSYYVAQEAAVLGDAGRRLGPLGSKILAISILGALQKLPPDFPEEPNLGLANILKPAGIQTLPDLLRVPDLPDYKLGDLIKETGSDQV